VTAAIGIDREPSSIEAMALGFLLAQLHAATPEFVEREPATVPCNTVFWPFLGHRFRLAIEEIPTPAIPDTPDRRDARAATRAAIGGKS
jgi:hypothetical protein